MLESCAGRLPDAKIMSSRGNGESHARVRGGWSRRWTSSRGAEMAWRRSGDCRTPPHIRAGAVRARLLAHTHRSGRAFWLLGLCSRFVTATDARGLSFWERRWAGIASGWIAGIARAGAAAPEFRYCLGKVNDARLKWLRSVRWRALGGCVVGLLDGGAAVR